MALNPEQVKLQQELKAQADAFEQLMTEIPESIKAAWHKLVGYMREYHYMDELWDGKELGFCPSGEKEALVTMTLIPDKILVSISGTEQRLLESETPEAADEIIQIIKTKQLPDRVLPNDNMVVSPGGGRCDLCLWNVDTIAKNDRRIEMSIGFAKCYGHVDDFTQYICNSDHENCGHHDIGAGVPGLTANEVTHILLPYCWARRSRYL